MEGIVSEKGQVTIPKKLRDILGLNKGRVIDFEAKNGLLIGRKKVGRAPLQEVVGLLRDKIPDVDDYLERARGRPLSRK
jgi:AbrB family looped-hinge helix DNA binding protein